MSSWTPPELQKKKQDSTAWKPPELDTWSPPAEVFENHPSKITETWKLKELKSQGQKLTEQQERLLWEEEENRPILDRAVGYVKQAAKGIAEAVPPIAEGSVELFKKGIAKPIYALPAITAAPVFGAEKQKVYGTPYTREEGKKIYEDMILAWRSFGAGVARDAEEMSNAIVRGAMFGTGITDAMMGIDKEERFRSYMNRENMRELERAAAEDQPDRMAALLAENPLLRGVVDVALKMQGVDEESRKAGVEEYTRLVQESGLTKEQLDEQIMAAGEFFSPVAIPGYNRITSKLAQKTGKIVEEKTGKILSEVVAPAGSGIEATGRFIDRTGKAIQTGAAELGRRTVDDPDTLVKSAVNTLVMPIRPPAKGAERFGALVKDISRQAKMGIAGRKGIIQRAGEDELSSQLTKRLFGAQGWGGVARAKTADWMLRQGAAIAQPAVNGGVLNLAMGLPDAETAEQGGYMFGYGMGIGGLAGTRLPDRAMALVDPTTSGAEKISRVLTPDFNQRRLDEDADIRRFLAKSSPEFQQKMADFANIENRKAALDAAIAEQKAKLQSSIGKDETAWLQSYIKNLEKHRASLENSTPETEQELLRQVQLTFIDAFDQAQMSASASGLNDFNIVVLENSNIENFYRKLYGETLTNAENVKNSLIGKPNLSQQDAQALMQADEVINRFNRDIENAANSRGFAIQEDSQDPNNENYQPDYRRRLNQKGATVVINGDLVKNLNHRGFDLRRTVMHELYHGLSKFKEVQDMQRPLRQYLFDQMLVDERGNQIYDEKGEPIVASDGIYSEADLMLRAAFYARQFSPNNPQEFFAQFGGNKKKMLAYVKEEIVSELGGFAGDYDNGSRAALDDIGRTIMDWAEINSRNGYLKKAKEALRQKGVIFDKYGAFSDVLGAEMNPEQLAMFRVFQRNLRDMQSSLTYNRSQEKIENDIPWTKVMNSRVLQERNKDTGIFETKPILKITTPDGKITEVPIPENAQLNPFIDVYVAKNGLIVDADGNPIQDLPAELLSSLPLNDGTKFELDTTIVRDVTGKPIVISPAEMKSRALNRTRAIVDAMQTAPKDDSGVRMEDTGNGNFRGIMSPSQIAAVVALPNSVVAPKLKRLIKLINDILARKDGTRIFMEYQASLLKGKYKALSPRFRDEIPIGFQVSKDGNFLVTTISVSRMYDKAEAWASKKPENLKLWDNDLGRFWDSVMKVLQNHAEGKVGETGLDDDPERAREKKNAVNDLFNLYNADTKALNPRRTTLPRVKGKDPMDRVIAARRLDRINAFEESVMQKMPVNYGKILENYLPAYNPMATPQTPEEFMQNTGGSVTASEIRNAIKNGEEEQLELELRNSDDIRPFETLIIEQNEAGEPTLRIDSTINPENASFFEEDEVVLDVNAETEQQIAQIRAEQIKDSPDAVDSDILQGQNNIPTQELLNLYDQQSLDEKSAKLPDAKITLGKDAGGDPLFAVATPEGKYIGTLGFAIAPEGRPDAIRVDMFRINSEYANQGYEEAVLRELAKYAQTQGITTLYSERVQPEKVKEFQNLFPTTATRPYYGQPQERDIVSEVDMTTQYMPAGSPEQFAQSQSEEYGLEAGQQAEMRLTPKTLFNLYWIMTEPEPNNEYGKSIRKEYIDRYTNLYKNVFKDLVRKQIEKYINRGRVDPEVTKAALSSANSAEDLEKLMRGTYRSDMKRRNDVWNIAAEHLTNLEKAQTPKDKLFYMDRLNNSIHNTQELLFSKFANAGSLMTAFDRIAAAKSTAAYRNFVDKDLREADSFGGTAYLPAVNYTIPKDPRMLMADFYLLTTADIANIFANPLEKKGGVGALYDPAERIKGLRSEEYLANLNEAIDTLSDQAQQHMKDALLFSVSAELRHVYVNSQPDRVKPLLEHPFMQKYKEIYDAYKFLSETKTPKYMDTYVESIQPESRAARITKGSNDNYRRSYAATRKAMEETGTSLEEVATIAEKLFREGRWNSSYGGDKWGNISEGLRNVAQAKTRAEKIKAIDDAYALQHNTGKALNKLQRYMRAGSYAWLDQMLDFKYHALSPREFMPLTSLAAMKIAAPALIDVGYPAKDGMRRNLIEKTNHIFVEEIETVVNKLVSHQEDIYSNIGVTAKKGTGRDINAELVKWLTKQLTSHYGAGTIYLDKKIKDAVPYVRVLLAEKMAWRPQLPPDIQASFEKLKKEEAEAKAEAETKAAMIVPTSWETIAKLPPSAAQTKVKNWKQYWVNWLGYNVFRKAPAEAREKFANMLLDIIYLIDEDGNIQITNKLPDMIINEFEYPNNLSIVKHVPDSKRPIGYKKIAEYIDTIKSEAEMLAMKIAEASPPRSTELPQLPLKNIKSWHEGMMQKWKASKNTTNKMVLFNENDADKILDAIFDPITGELTIYKEYIFQKSGVKPPPPQATNTWAWIEQAIQAAHIAKSTAEQAIQNAPTAKSAEEKWKNEWMAKGLTPLTDTQKSKILDAMIGAAKANSDQYLFKKLESEQLFGNEKGLDLNDLYVNDPNSYQWVSEAWFSTQTLTGKRAAQSKISQTSKSTEFPKELEWLAPDEKTHILQTINDALLSDLTANEWLEKFRLYGKTADELYSPTAKQFLKELYLQKQGELVKTVKEAPAKLKFLNPALLQDLKERLDMVYRLKSQTQTPFYTQDINKVVSVWETINWQTKPQKLSAVEMDEIYAYAYDYVSKLASPSYPKSTNLSDIPAPSAESATPESTLKDIPAYTEAPQLYAYTDIGTPLVENAIKKAVMDYGGEMQKQDIIDFLNSDKKYSSIVDYLDNLPNNAVPALVSFAKDYAAWIYTASPAEFDAEKRTVEKTLDSELSVENAQKTQWKDVDTTSVTAIETPNGTQYTKQGQPLPVMSFSNGQFPISTPFEIYDTFRADPQKFEGTAVAGGFLNPDGETKTDGVLFYAKDPKDGEPFWWAYPLSIMDADLAGEFEQLTLDQNQSWEEKFNELLMNPQSDLYDSISGLGEYSFSPIDKPQTAEPAPTKKESSGPKKEKNLIGDYKTQLFEFGQAINYYANDYWNQVVSYNEENWENQLAKKMFDQNLFANDQTISVAGHILVPMTSSSEELFILHGKENENKTGYTMDGAVEFGPIGSKPKKLLMQDISDWLKHYIEYYENQI